MSHDSLSSVTPVGIDLEQFTYVRDLITGFCGVALSADYRSRMQRVVGARMMELGIDDVSAYLRGLKRQDRDGGELSHLVDRVTNTETYFFREEFQLDALSEVILPELVEGRARRRRLTFWSAGCASGEEPFTLAMLLHQSLLWKTRLSDWEVRILGTDINRNMIRKARHGVYSRSSFKALEASRCRSIQSRFFQRREDQHAVTQELRDLVSFLRLNLLDRDGAGLFGEMDLILCRNVLMYFPVEIRLQVLQGFFRKLAVGGYLLLGHSENLLGLDTPYEALRIKDSLVYRKPERQQWRDRGGQWGS